MSVVADTKEEHEIRLAHLVIEYDLLAEQVFASRGHVSQKRLHEVRVNAELMAHRWAMHRGMPIGTRAARVEAISDARAWLGQRVQQHQEWLARQG